MSPARWGERPPVRLPRFLRRREAERRRVEAFLAAIRRSADCGPACDHRTPVPRPAFLAVVEANVPEGTLIDIDAPTEALPMHLVTLLVPVR